MSSFKVGERVYHDEDPGCHGTVLGEEPRGSILVNWDGIGDLDYFPQRLRHVEVVEVAEENAVQPNVYKFPNAEVRDISAHLTSFGGQAVQYVARATRLDGLVKGKPVQDIEKAIQVLQWELERLQEAK